MDAASTTPPQTTVVAALITALQTLITSAQADAAAVGASGDTITAAQQLVFHAQAVIASLRVIAAGLPGYPITVQDGPFGPETIFYIAERELGDLTRFTDILALNNKKFIALTPGDVLLIPQS